MGFETGPGKWIEHFVVEASGAQSPYDVILMSSVK